MRVEDGADPSRPVHYLGPAHPVVLPIPPEKTRAESDQSGSYPAAVKKLRHSLWLKTSMSSPMAIHRPLTVRSAAFAQERLELGEGVLDGIEVGAREVEEMGGGGFDQLAHSGAFVAREIVHDHRIALAQLWDEDLLDIGLEGDAVDRAVRDERRDEAAQRQAR